MARTGVRSWTLAWMTALTALAGCHSVTEYTDSGDFGVVVLNASDLSVGGYVAGMDGARTVVSMGDSALLVGCSNGMVHTVNSEGLFIASSEYVTAGTGGGLDCFMKSPVRSSLYAITESGRIVEFSSADFSLLDEFAAGPSPSSMCRSPSGVGRIYIADDQQGVVREINALTNQEYGSYNVGACPMAVAPNCADPPMLVTVHGQDTGIYSIRLDWSSVNWLRDRGTLCDVASLSTDSIFCALEPAWDEESGAMLLCEGGWLSPIEVYSCEVDGHPTAVCCSPDPQLPYFYAACASGDETLVVALNYQSREVEMTTLIDGYPYDITTHRNGEKIIVLTAL